MGSAAVRLIVFDLDGTLVDSRLDLAESANKLLSAHGAAPLPVDRIVSMVGEGARVLVERVLTAAALPLAAPQALAEFLAIYERRLTRHTRPYPGVVRALDALRGRVPLAVLTNKPSRHTSLLLDALGLTTYFTEIVGDDGRFPRKPDPTGLEALMSRHGVGPEVTVMVGDSVVDVETARRANCRVCVAGYGFGGIDTRTLPPTAIEVTDPAGLEDALLRAIRGETPLS